MWMLLLLHPLRLSRSFYPIKQYSSAGQLVILRAYDMFNVLSIQAYRITLLHESTFRLLAPAAWSFLGWIITSRV